MAFSLSAKRFRSRIFRMRSLAMGILMASKGSRQHPTPVRRLGFTSPAAETKMTGILASWTSAHMRRHTSYPSISGIMTSIKTRSGGFFPPAQSLSSEVAI